MSQLLIENARVFDGVSADCAEGMSVLVEGDRICEVSATPITAANATRIDAKGRTLMPGLIDLHIHAYASDVNVQRIDGAGQPYRTAHAARMLGHALDCGFTTVRDIGGGDWSLAQAIEHRMVRAPRFFYAGKILSMTGGHGDFREMSTDRHNHGYCSCGSFNSLCVVADGVDDCIKAVREELRRGAHCIKIMGSGGIASPTDPIWMNQYREDEIRAIVNECRERRTYVSAHCHPPEAARRSVEFGVRVIEHGTLLDADTAAFLAGQGAFVIPTMVIQFTLVELGRQLGFPPQSQEKADYAAKRAIEAMDHMRTAGVKVGFGTDLLGELYVQQCREFTIRSEVFQPVEILRQATSVAADVLMHADRLGCIKPDAYADLLLVDGDPLSDISLLARDGQALDLIMRGGEIVKSRMQ